VYVIVGPSGSGKSTLGDHFKSRNISELISHTTRSMRAGEQNGVNYYFVSNEEFDTIDFFENEPYSLKRYGLSRKELSDKMQNNNKVFTIMNKDGALTLKEKAGKDYKVVIIYVYTDPSILVDRMHERGDSDKSIEERLENMHETGELQNINIADYVIVSKNKTIEDCNAMLDFIESRD
jgi:guanylate kinase